MPYIERKDKDGKVLDRYFTTRQQPKKEKARKEADAQTNLEKKK